MKKQIIALCLVICTITNLFFVNTTKVLALESNSLDTKRHNYNFIETEDNDNIHYTYEEGGKTYHVHEKAEDNFSKIETQIYVIDGSKKKLVEEYTTYIRKNGDTVSLDKYSSGYLVEQRLIHQSYNTNTRYTEPYTGMLYYDGSTGKFYTGWWYAYFDERYNNVKNLSLTALAIIIATVVGAELANPQMSIDIYDAAKAFIDANVEVLYWHQEVYQVYQVRYPERTFYGSFVGQRIYTTVYADESKTNQLDYFIYETRDPEEWPSITIGSA